MLWLIIIQVRKKVSTSQQPPTLYYDNKTHFTSEPYLMDESETLHQPVRRGSQRRPAQNNVSSNASGRKSVSCLFSFNSVSWFSILLNTLIEYLICVSAILYIQVQYTQYTLNILIHSFFTLSPFLDCTYSTSKVKYIFRCSRSKF